MSFSFFPRVVYRTKSAVSGEIVVRECLGKYTLHVQGLVQSGGLVGRIWQKPLKRIRRYQPSLADFLVLGLGGGTVVRLIKTYWPKAKIVGVEIDPQIIEIGRQYFGLGKVSDLEIIQADALVWLSRFYRSSQRRFDLVIVDLYLGDQFPEKVASGRFLKEIKRLLLPNGSVIFNRLRKKKENFESFKHQLEKHFPQVELVKTATNLFFRARV